MLTVVERQLALAQRFPCWQAQCLHEMLDSVALQFPNRPYVITDERVYSYRDIQSWSMRIARGLVAEGVRPGDHVGMILANYPEFVAVKFAIARAGAVAVPINFLNRAAELQYVLQQSDTVLLITMDRFRDLDYLRSLDEIAPGWDQLAGQRKFPYLRRVVVFSTSQTTRRPNVMSLEELAARSHDQVLPASCNAAAPADIIYTSGTTGGPKGVLLTHDMLLRTAYGSAYSRAFQDERRVLFALPMYHVYGYVEGMLAVLFVGGAIIPQLQFDPVNTLNGIVRHRVNDVLFVPTMTLAVLDVLRHTPYDLSSLGAVLSSGGKSPEDIWEQIYSLFGDQEITTGYGMTETTASTTVTRPDDPIERLRTTNGRMRDVGIAGDPQRGNRLAVYRVVDSESGAPLPLGSVGELVVMGLGVTAGYYKKPEETAAAFDEQGWLLTGDLGVIDAEGYITLRGRKKECYRCGGEQVFPLEVEDVLIQHPAVAQAYIVPLSDRRMGEVGVAYIVMQDSASVTPAELIEHCAQRLARFKVPKHVITIKSDELPTTATGRPRKFLLAQRAAEEIASL